MKESAFVFFTLLNYSYKVDAEIRLNDINVAMTPHLEKESGNKVVDSYRKRADGILDLFDVGDVSTTEEIKQAFGQK